MNRVFALIACVVMFCGCNAHPQTAKRHEPKTSQSLELTMPVVTVNSAEQFYDLFETDKQVVLQVSSMAPHQEIVQSWQNDLHRLRPYLEERLPELAGKKLNVVLQFHGWQGQIEKCAIDSQKNVATKLEEQKPRLLITEGTYFDRFSKDGLLDEVNISTQEFATVMNAEVTRENRERDFAELCEQNAAFDYAYRHPECIAVGGEWRGVHTLDAMMQWPGSPPEAQIAFECGSRIRTWMTAARASEFMRQHNLNECTIVIGAGHRDDFETLARIFGVNVNFSITHVHKS
jgi:hypothetical protein